MTKQFVARKHKHEVRFQNRDQKVITNYAWHKKLRHFPPSVCCSAVFGALWRVGDALGWALTRRADKYCTMRFIFGTQCPPSVTPLAKENSQNEREKKYFVAWSLLGDWFSQTVWKCLLHSSEDRVHVCFTIASASD